VQLGALRREELDRIERRLTQRKAPARLVPYVASHKLGEHAERRHGSPPPRPRARSRNARVSESAACQSPQAFDFSSRVFAVPGALFQQSADGVPALRIEFGEVNASLPLKTIPHSFTVSDHDRGLLDLVVKGLKYVREIRPGDSIPNEVLDGRASWAIDDRHAATARSRLTVQLVGWFLGRATEINDTAHLLKLADNPEVKERVNDALSKAAGQLGLPPSEKEGVIVRIDSLVRELAYVEALRDRFRSIERLEKTLDLLVAHFHGDAMTAQAIIRSKSLMRRPLVRFRAIFDQVDAMTGEVMSALQNIDNQIAFIRKSRDDLWEH
jgi:hypothetical protein